MTAAGMANRDRLVQLLADRAVQGLSDAEARELDLLLAQTPDADPLAMDLAAAACDLACCDSAEFDEPLPAAVRERVLASSAAFITRQPLVPAAATPGRTHDGIRPGWRPSPAMAGERRPLIPAWSGWVAAAAAVLLAAAVWTTPPDNGAASTQTAGTGGIPGLVRAVNSTARERFVRSVPDVVLIPWSATGDPACPAKTFCGDVVWSSARQTGYMSIRGLKPNDPSQHQYQLWIFRDDPATDPYPVHGGVFDVPSGQDEVVVPIKPHLYVAEPVAFAITIERPGGVWVSSRERVPLVATLKD